MFKFSRHVTCLSWSLLPPSVCPPPGCPSYWSWCSCGSSCICPLWETRWASRVDLYTCRSYCPPSSTHAPVMCQNTWYKEEQVTIYWRTGDIQHNWLFYLFYIALIWAGWGDHWRSTASSAHLNSFKSDLWSLIILHNLLIPLWRTCMCPSFIIPILAEALSGLWLWFTFTSCQIPLLTKSC